MSAATPPPARGLACPKCGAHKLAVVWVRAQVGRTVRARRCRACGHRLRTTERVDGPR